RRRSGGQVVPPRRYRACTSRACHDRRRGRRRKNCVCFRYGALILRPLHTPGCPLQEEPVSHQRPDSRSRGGARHPASRQKASAVVSRAGLAGVAARLIAKRAPRDLTEPKRARERQASFRLLFSHHPLPMWVSDVETLRFLEVNATAVAHYGYSREE